MRPVKFHPYKTYSGKHYSLHLRRLGPRLRGDDSSGVDNKR